MKTWISIFVLLAVAGAGGWFAWHKWGQPEKETAYRTVQIERGDITQVVRATGIIQPVRLVQVGTQVNGIVQKLYADFNSRVKAGDVIARIDPSVYQANLAQGEANLARSQAAVDEARSNLLKARNDLARITGLASNQLISTADLDAAVASAAVAEAQVKVAEAQVRQYAAALELARANLSYTVIVAPVDGMIISRNVDEGQTVVASMSAQTLFTIATDLRTILINASVPEADVGPVAAGQTVSFTVDAYPTTFTGVVSQIRLAASSVQNVVTYPVMVRADNPDEKLFPGMTANISCVIAQHTNVLKVANAALRFRPEKADGTNKAESAGRPAASGNSPGASATAGRGGERQPGVFVKQPNGSLTPLRITTSLTDGTFTEISGDDLREGLEVVTGMQAPGTKNAVVNPFMPSPPAPRTRSPRL